LIPVSSGFPVAFPIGQLIESPCKTRSLFDPRNCAEVVSTASGTNFGFDPFVARIVNFLFSIRIGGLGNGPSPWTVIVPPFSAAAMASDKFG